MLGSMLGCAISSKIQEIVHWKWVAHLNHSQPSHGQSVLTLLAQKGTFC